MFAHFWAYIHPTLSTHRSFTDLLLIDPTSIPHRPNPHRPYILLSFQNNLFVMIPTLNSEAVYHHHISIAFPHHHHHHHHIWIVFPFRHYHHVSIVFRPRPPLHYNYDRRRRRRRRCLSILLTDATDTSCIKSKRKFAALLRIMHPPFM